MADTMQGLKRTHYCGTVTPEMIGREVVVCGWAQKTRDMGTLVFIDLRDRTGIVQLAFDDKTDPAVLTKAQRVRAEYVLMARGVLRQRESVNHEIPTGEVEVYVTELRVLAESNTPPFAISDDSKGVKEELRLKYRYLDLRRPEMQNAIAMRHRIVKVARDYYDTNGFLEIETPVLIKSTPEGARDYLVPSRVQQGKFYALPQSPQLYKQILMCSGFDRYMQIARCFRDEDLRADRQPEFTQIDVEMSFIDEEDIMAMNEGFMKRVFKEVLGKELETPFRRIKYQDAMDNYGIDKPDTRFDLRLHDLSEILKNTGFAVFSGAIAGGGSVRGINAKGAAEKLSRKEIDKLTDFVKTYRAKGLAYTRWTHEGRSSSFEKFLTEEEIAGIHKALDAEEGDLLLIVADAKNEVVYDALGQLRNHLAQKLGLIEPGTFDLLWVTEFPLFEYSEEEGRYMAKHHPFTCPMLEDLDRIESDPGHCRARAYDMVMNGCEVGGGSIRIHRRDVQNEVFKAIGLTEEQAKEKFGFMMDAFEYGAPPHGGLAFGLDRLIMIMAKRDSIRDVIAFPKTQSASCLMTQAPNDVDEKQLRELHIRATLVKKDK